jgi:AcrR family transcriptional regulator
VPRAPSPTTRSRRRLTGPERRAKLLDAARDVFGREGFHAASMDAVARRAGVTKPTLYDHFPSKRDLYLALIDADLETVRHRVSAALAAPTGNRERIRASFRAYFDFVDEHGPGFRLLMQEVVGADPDRRRRVGRVRERILAEVAALIVRESEGRLDPAHAETVALALVGMVETAAQRDPGGDPVARNEAVDTLVRFAWRGITGLTEPDSVRRDDPRH